MTSYPSLSSSWFVVLPDVDNGQSVVAAMRTLDPQVLRHASGRPWIVGQWPDEALTLVKVGLARTAVMGQFLIDAAQLAPSLANAANDSNIACLARKLSGSFHLISSVAGETCVQGTISALRQVSYARVAGITVAADDAYVLASLTRAKIDSDALALRMAYPQLPFPLDDQPMWCGVHNVPPDCYLVLDRAGRFRVRRWWLPPDPVLPLSEGASMVREALASAVAVRATRNGPISTDLSGGMDSTSLCFLAASQAAHLLTVRKVEVDPGSDDDRWGRHVAARLPDVEHLVFTPSEVPTIYANVAAAAEEHIDEPYRWIRTWGRHQHLVTLLGERGCGQHFTGHGGDEVFGTFPSYLHALVRTNPRVGARHLRGFQALRQWSWRDTARELRDRATYAEWLATTADRLSTPPPVPTAPHLGWGWPVRMPPWATPDAISATQALFRGVVAGLPSPLAGQRAQHEILQYVRTCGRAVRQVAALVSRSGAQLAAPYLVHQVIEAALSVRLHERMTPWWYKPLLAASMRGIVPDEILDRTTKGDFTADVYAGLRVNRGQLLDLFADSALAEHGLIDADVLRKAIVDVHPTLSTLIPLEQTIACETWLRAAESVSPDPPGSHDAIYAPPRCFHGGNGRRNRSAE